VTKTTAIRTRFFATLETEALKLNPALAGRIDWDFAAFLFNSARTPANAAAILVARAA